MSLQKLNKIPGLKPEKEIPEAHQGPSKTLAETIRAMKNIKSELREIEHYIEKCEGSGKGVTAQIEEQLMKTKQEMVKLERMLEEQLEPPDENEDVFEEEGDWEADRKL